MNFMRCLQAGCMWCWTLTLSKHHTPEWKIQNKADKIPDGWMAVPGNEQTTALLLVRCKGSAGFNQPRRHLCPNISLQHSTKTSALTWLYSLTTLINCAFWFWYHKQRQRTTVVSPGSSCCHSVVSRSSRALHISIVLPWQGLPDCSVPTATTVWAALTVTTKFMLGFHIHPLISSPCLYKLPWLVICQDTYLWI